MEWMPPSGGTPRATSVGTPKGMPPPHAYGPGRIVLPPGFETAFTRYGEGYGLEAMTADEGIAVLTQFLEEIGVLKPSAKSGS